MNKFLFPVITNAAFNLDSDIDNIGYKVIAEYKNTTKEAVFEYAKERKILPFVANLLCKLDCDCNFWKDIIDNYRNRNQQVIAALDQVFRKFEVTGVHKVFVSQNFGAVLTGETDIALFASGDVDLCGDVLEKDLINQVFEELGYNRKDRYCGHKLISSEFSNDSLLPSNFHFGICYDTISRLKLPNPIEMNEFVDWDNLLQYRDTHIILPPVDAQTYICLVHISLHSFSRAPDIRLYVDVQNCMKKHPNMRHILDYAKQDGTIVRVVAAYLLTLKLFRLNWQDLAMKDAYDKYRKRVDHLIKLVYNETDNELIYEPNKIETLRIESAYYDNFINKFDILLPKAKWMCDVYWSCGMIAHIKHLGRIIH